MTTLPECEPCQANSKFQIFKPGDEATTTRALLSRGVDRDVSHIPKPVFRAVFLGPSTMQGSVSNTPIYQRHCIAACIEDRQTRQIALTTPSRVSDNNVHRFVFTVPGLEQSALDNFNWSRLQYSMIIVVQVPEEFCRRSHETNSQLIENAEHQPCTECLCLTRPLDHGLL